MVRGGSTPHRSAIFRDFSHQILAQAVQYLAMLRYVLQGKDGLKRGLCDLQTPDGTCWMVQHLKRVLALAKDSSS
jgi:hypothetical protein